MNPLPQTQLALMKMANEKALQREKEALEEVEEMKIANDTALEREEQERAEKDRCDEFYQ